MPPFRLLAPLLCSLLALWAGPLSGATFSLDRESRFLIKFDTLQLRNYLEQAHYNRTDADRIDAEALLENYLSSLDSQRIFFLQDDVEEVMARFSSTLHKGYLREGNLFPAFEIYGIYRERALARLEWIDQRLQEPFDFTVEETYAPDRTEAAWPADGAEADELWRKRLKFELLQELLNDETMQRAIEKVSRRYERTTRRIIEELEAKNVQELFLNSYAEMYDPHSTYFSPESMEDFAILTQNALEGIGAVLRRSEDGYYCVIQELIPGGPAELSGRIHPGDRIVEVQQKGEEPVEVLDMKLRKVVQQIRGERGTPVTLTILPVDATDESERTTVTLIRDEIKLTEKLARARTFEVPAEDGTTVPVGVIELPSFYGGGPGAASTSEDVAELIERLKEKEIEGLVLDLRRNGGGLLDEAVRLTGLFIPEGPVVQKRDFRGNIDADWDRNDEVAWEGPLVVLVSKRSASASEIVAGALKTHARALVVGDEQTHGKGTVQAIYEFGRQSFFPTNDQQFGGAKITIQKYYLPDGSSTQNRGIPADISLPSMNTFLPIGEADLPNALPWDSIDPLDWDQSRSRLAGLEVDEDLRSRLSALSESRREALPEFAYLQESIDFFGQKQEQEEFSLNLEQRRSQLEADKERRKQLDDELDRLSSLEYNSSEILLALTAKNDAVHQEKLRTSPLPDGRDRAGQYYAQIYYHETEPGGRIEEVRTTSFDYERLLDEVPGIVELMALDTEAAVTPAAIEAVLQRLKNAEDTAEFDAEALFADETELSEEELQVVLPAFFEALIAYDPEVLEGEGPLDIHLRESLRITADWARGAEPAQAEEPAEAMTARAAAHETEG